MRIFRLLLVIALLPALALASPALAARSFVWQRVDTSVQVRADGTLRVVETLTLRYTGGPFTFAYRDLPDRRLDSLGNIALRADDRTFQRVDEQEGSTPYTYSVYRTSGTQRVRWVYPPTTGGERTFTLSYDVAGAVRRLPAADEVWWAIVFAQRAEPVEQASGRIVLPATVAPERIEAATPDWPGEIARSNDGAAAQASGIPAGRELTLRVRFPKGIVGGGAPGWQAAADAQARYDATVRPAVNVALSALAALLLLVLGAALWLWWRRNRDPQAHGFVAGQLPAPPDELSPALAARLLGATSGQGLLGTLIDLANRGYMTFHEEMGGWLGKSRQVVLHRADRGTRDLEPHEVAALDAVFAGAPEVNLASRSSALVRAASEEARRWQVTLIERGYQTAEGLARRRRGLVAGGVLTALGLLGLVPAFVLAERVSWWLPPVSAALALGGLAWLIAAGTVRGLTQSGADTAARWRAFQRYLRRITAETAVGGQFSQLLPYAVALGDAQRLTRIYGATAEPLPVWYHPVLYTGAHAHAGPGVSAAGGTLLLHDFSQNFVSALSSAGSSVGASGGAGGAGGGASGGGGGGAG